MILSRISRLLSTLLLLPNLLLFRLQGFAKVIKSKAYFKRYQVQFRRRRENKTDYYARKRLIWVDKNKYNAPKYRFVVRFSNRDVITAIVSTDVTGDRIVASAYGHELSKYGVKFGFNNYASTYAAGLLLARRVNTRFGLPFIGVKDAAGRAYNVADENEDDSGASDRRPFQAVLDVGLHRTTTGARIFGALKGICDGGVAIPHSTTRFPGAPSEENDFNFDLTRKYIFGGHIGEYMTMLASEDPDKFKQQFAAAAAAGISGDDMEALYQSVHDKIRAETKDGLATKTTRGANQLGYFRTRSAAKPATTIKGDKYFDTKAKTMVHLRRRFSVQQRKARILNKLNKFLKKETVAAEAPAAAAEEEESGSDSE